MKARITILISLLSALCAIKAAAGVQTDIDNFNDRLWNSETMVNAVIEAGGVSQQGYLLAAYVDGTLRGYCATPVELAQRPGVYIYCVRVKGDAEDTGKAIDLKVVDADYTEIDFTCDHVLQWNGETIGYPSAPVRLMLDTTIRVTDIGAISGKTFYRQDYSAESPLDLSDYYWLAPADATNMDVYMELLDGSAEQGTLVQRDGKWGFVPSATCKGAVQIRITPVSNPAINAVLTLTAQVRIEAIADLTGGGITMNVGDERDLSECFSVVPADADMSDIAYDYDENLIYVGVTQSYDLGVEGLNAGTTDLAIYAKSVPGVSCVIPVTVKPGFEWAEVRLMPCADDITAPESGEIVGLRQAANTKRGLQFVSHPLPDFLNIDRITVTAACDADMPEGWKAAEFTVDHGFGSDSETETMEFTPLVPGNYRFTFRYGEMPLKGEDGEAIAIDLHICSKTQLDKGWNWISATAETGGVKLSDAITDPGSLVEARTQRHFLVNDPEFGFSIGFPDADGNFTNDFILDRTVDNGHFRIKTSSRGTALYTDGVFDLKHSAWTLKKGWNWVNCPAFYSMGIDLLDLSDIFSEGDVVKGRNGFSTYTAEGWVGGLTTLYGGEAYSVYTSYSGKLDFDMSEYEQATGNSYYQAPARRHWQYDVNRFIDNMGIIAELQITNDVLLNDAASRYTIGAFVGEECRGEGVYADGRWFITVHGEAGERVTLKVMDTGTGKVTECEGAIEFAPMAGSFKEPVLFNAPDINSLGSIEGDSPAIFASGATIVGAERIYDIQGRDVTGANGHLAPGIYIAKVSNMTTKITVN